MARQQDLALLPGYAAREFQGSRRRSGDKKSCRDRANHNLPLARAQTRTSDTYVAQPMGQMRRKGLTQSRLDATPRPHLRHSWPADRGLEEVGQVIQRCIDQSVAPGTLKIYKRVKARFLGFGRSLKIPALQTPKLRNIFIAHLIHESEDRSLGRRRHPEALLRAASRSRKPVKHRTKASKDDVEKIIEVGLTTDSPGLMCAATTVMLALSALLRVSKVSHLQFQDFTYKGDGAWGILIKRPTRTRGEVVVAKWGLQETKLWQIFCRLKRPLLPQKILFSGKVGEAPSRDFVAKNITKVAKAAGLQHKKLTSHSLRGGAATHAIRQGVDSGKIMLAIRWKSFQGFKSYIEPSPL
ncbi:site-specific recombinase, phage integrase family [Ostertagia ostertagi]